MNVKMNWKGYYQLLLELLSMSNLNFKGFKTKHVHKKGRRGYPKRGVLGTKKWVYRNRAF